MVQGHKGVTVARRFWLRFPLGERNYYILIFSYLRSGIKVWQKPGVSRNASIKFAESGERSALTLGSVCLLYAGYKANKKNILTNI